MNQKGSMTCGRLEVVTISIVIPNKKSITNQTVQITELSFIISINKDGF